MIRAFEIVLGDYGLTEAGWGRYDISDDEKKARQLTIDAEFREGMDLFAKYYGYLWW